MRVKTWGVVAVCHTSANGDVEVLCQASCYAITKRPDVVRFFKVEDQIVEGTLDSVCDWVMELGAHPTADPYETYSPTLPLGYEPGSRA